MSPTVRINDVDGFSSAVLLIIAKFHFFPLLIFDSLSFRFTVQDNRELENRLAQNTTTEMGEMRSMHDELAFLEESGYTILHYH